MGAKTLKNKRRKQAATRVKRGRGAENLIFKELPIGRKIKQRGTPSQQTHPKSIINAKSKLNKGLGLKAAFLTFWFWGFCKRSRK